MLRYRPEIDGLRALAVIPVILFHFNVPGFHGGFVGVDIFFVISGYLITALILKELHEGTFSFWNFYERRIRRLMPAAVFVVAVSYLLAYQILLLEEFRDFGKSIVAFTLLHANVHFFNSSGYFDISSQLKPILHTWSLSVEEQFYLIFPVILFFSFKTMRKFIPHLIAVILILSFFVSVYTVSNHPEFAFYMLPSRAWELLLGAVLALGILPAIRRRVINNVVSLSGLAMIVASMVFYNEHTAFPGVAALLPCLGVALIIWSNSNKLDASGTLFSRRPLVFIGLISYPLYLWHWPIFVFYRYVVNRDIYLHEAFTLVLITFMLSYLTYRYIEQPVRQRRLLTTRVPLIVGVLVVSIIFIAIGRITDLTHGVPDRLPEVARSYAMGVFDRYRRKRNKCHVLPVKQVLENNICIIGNQKREKPDFIIWGDSHAFMLVPMIKKMAREKGVQGVFASHASCYPVYLKENKHIDKKCVAFNNAIISLIKKKEIPNIILAGYWWRDLRPSTNNSKIASLEIHKQIAHTLRELQGHRLFVFTGVPGYSSMVPDELAKAAMYDRKVNLPIVSRKTFVSYLNHIHNIFGKYDGEIRFVDVTKTLCQKNNSCALASGVKSLYRDTNHLSVTGAMKIRASFEPAFDQIRATALE